MESSLQPFRRISQDGENSNGSRRWGGRVEPNTFLQDTRQCGLRLLPDLLPEPIVARMHTRGPTEDFPWVYSRMPIVSDRIKQFFETHAPGQIEFVPVSVLYRGRLIKDIPRYWYLNPLIVVRTTRVPKGGRSLVQTALEPGDIGTGRALSFPTLDTFVCDSEVGELSIRQDLFDVLRAMKPTGVREPYGPDSIA